jgi:hypothetical protein
MCRSTDISVLPIFWFVTLMILVSNLADDLFDPAFQLRRFISRGFTDYFFHLTFSFLGMGFCLIFVHDNLSLKMTDDRASDACRPLVFRWDGPAMATRNGILEARILRSYHA